MSNAPVPAARRGLIRWSDQGAQLTFQTPVTQVTLRCESLAWTGLLSFKAHLSGRVSKPRRFEQPAPEQWTDALQAVPGIWTDPEPLQVTELLRLMNLGLTADDLPYVMFSMTGPQLTLERLRVLDFPPAACVTKQNLMHVPAGEMLSGQRLKISRPELMRWYQQTNRRLTAQALLRGRTAAIRSGLDGQALRTLVVAAALDHGHNWTVRPGSL